MGSSSYSSGARFARATADGFYSKSADQIFEQNTKRVIHDSMRPKDIKIREARDSNVHPVTVPIILALDLTGSMGHIPHDLIKDGLPTLIGGIIQNGIPSPALLFIGIGDHECDNYPLQVAQFESGDKELDMWLTRTYIEKGGGGNGGESYLLAWYFAAFHTVTDALEKRGKKGFLFTVGDEPTLEHLPQSALNELMSYAVGQGYSAKDLLKAAQEKYHVYHLHIMQGSAGQRSLSGWQDLLGQNCIRVNDYIKVADTIAQIIVSQQESEEASSSRPTTNSPEEEIIL
jgi:hypothetical protein